MTERALFELILVVFCLMFLFFIFRICYYENHQSYIFEQNKAMIDYYFYKEKQLER